MSEEVRKKSPRLCLMELLLLCLDMETMSLP
jgi:hypothetical protein